jgi:hypothetical protein
VILYGREDKTKAKQVLEIPAALVAASKTGQTGETATSTKQT